MLQSTISSVANPEMRLKWRFLSGWLGGGGAVDTFLAGDRCGKRR